MPITLVDPYLRGAARTKAIILEATSDLIAQRPPSMVRIVDIAAEAEVNQGLIQHYFGGKGPLIEAAMTYMADQVTTIAHQRIIEPLAEVGPEKALAAALDTIFDPEVPAAARYFRAAVLAGAVGETPESLRSDFPVVRILLKLGNPMFGLNEEQTAMWAATAGSMVLGWLVLEPSILETTGLGQQYARDTLLTTVTSIALGVKAATEAPAT